MGMLFNKIIPMEMLAQMPLPFVHRLRDLQIKRLEAQQQQMSGIAGNSTPMPPAIPATAIDDIVDELS